MTQALLKTLDPQTPIQMNTGDKGEDIEKAKEESIGEIYDRVDQQGESESSSETPKEVPSEVTQEVKVLEEKVPEEKKEEPKRQDQFYRKFQALSKREKFLSQKEKEYRDKEKELEELRQFRTSFEKDPYGVLEKKGHSLEEWTKRILTQDHPKTNLPEVEELRKEINDIKHQKKEEEQKFIHAQREQTYQQEVKAINQFIDEHSDQYPLVDLYGDYQLIFDIRAEKFSQESKEFGEEYALENLISYEDAAKLAEDYRETFVKSKNTKLGKISDKLKAMMEVKEEKQEESKKKEVEKEEVREDQVKLPERTKQLLGLRKTLTNKQQTTVPIREEKVFKSDADRIDYIASKYL